MLAKRQFTTGKLMEARLSYGLSADDQADEFVVSNAFFQTLLERDAGMDYKTFINLK